MHNREFKFGYQHFLLCQKSFLKVSSKWLLKNKFDNGKLYLGKTYSGERFRAILALLFKSLNSLNIVVLKMENLFKHNIFFTPGNEDRTSCISNDNFSINVVYETKEMILRGDNNIKYPKDLLDRIDPFLYYLASKYQKYKENNQYEAFFK